jgi:hypothetical protein
VPPGVGVVTPPPHNSGTVHTGLGVGVVVPPPHKAGGKMQPVLGRIGVGVGDEQLIRQGTDTTGVGVGDEQLTRQGTDTSGVGVGDEQLIRHGTGGTVGVGVGVPQRIRHGRGVGVPEMGSVGSGVGDGVGGRQRSPQGRGVGVGSGSDGVGSGSDGVATGSDGVATGSDGVGSGSEGVGTGSDGSGRGVGVGMQMITQASLGAAAVEATTGAVEASVPRRPPAPQRTSALAEIQWRVEIPLRIPCIIRADRLWAKRHDFVTSPLLGDSRLSASAAATPAAPRRAAGGGCWPRGERR